MLIEICFVDSYDKDLYNSIGPVVISTEIVEGVTEHIINAIKGEWRLYGTGLWYKHDDDSYTKDG